MSIDLRVMMQHWLQAMCTPRACLDGRTAALVIIIALNIIISGTLTETFVYPQQVLCDVAFYWIESFICQGCINQCSPLYEKAETLDKLLYPVICQS